jgi:WD40 repeat protein
MLGLDLVGHEREHVLSVDKSGVFKVWDLRTLALVQTFTAAPDLNGVRYYLNLSHRRVIVAAHHRRFQEFEFSYSNTPDLTDDEDIVMGIYNETMDAIITAAGCNVRIWESSTGHPVKTFSNVSAAPIVSICLDDRCSVGVSSVSLACLWRVSNAGGAHRLDLPRGQAAQVFRRRRPRAHHLPQLPQRRRDEGV